MITSKATKDEFRAMSEPKNQFHLPDLGEGVHEGQVLRILVAAGEPVQEDQPLMEVETDKSAVEIPSPYSGIVTSWHVEEKQIVNVGDLMVSFGVEGDAAPAIETPVASAPAAADISDTATTNVASAMSAPTPAAAPAPSGARPPASPAVRMLARRLGLDLMSIRGTGPRGRILRSDVQAASNGSGTPAVSSPSPVTTMPATSATARQTSPLAMAITPAAHPIMPPATPVAALTPAPASPAAGPSPAMLAAAVPADARRETDAFGAIMRSPISMTRRSIARIMTESVRTIPHVTDCDDADLTKLNALRREYNASVDPSMKVGMLPFMVRAVARALTVFPLFNAAFDAEKDELVFHDYMHIAIGMQTPRGLVAPVLRDAHNKSVQQLARDIDAMTAKARSGSFDSSDAAGATYTISNAGAMGGSRYSTPIITPPQVAVLAIGKSREIPWVVDGAVVPRLIAPFSHSMDHRVIDGAVEIAFMRHIIEDIESPGRLLI